jgi:hypothetical protein
LLQLSRASSVSAFHATPTISNLLSRGHWGEKSATNLPCHYAVTTISNCITTAMRSHGGPMSISRRWRRQRVYGRHRSLGTVHWLVRRYPTLPAFRRIWRRNERPIHTLSVPAELKSFEEPSCLLPGESRKEFEIIRRMIIEDICPKTNLEWLWILDLTELSWEILRYRRLKEKILQTRRASAIASLLQRVDGLGMPPSVAMTRNPSTSEHGGRRY